MPLGIVRAEMRQSPSPSQSMHVRALNVSLMAGDRARNAISARTIPSGIYRDSLGHIRLIEAVVSYPRIVKGAFDKIRQAGRGMPAVYIRQLDSLAKITAYTTGPGQRQLLLAQAEMIVRASDESVPDEPDRIDVRRRYEGVIDAITRQEMAGLVAG